jgi:hypothetical protein
MVPELIESGRIAPESSIWGVTDSGEAKWKDVVIPVRRAFWAGAWQGLAGNVLVDDRKRVADGKSVPMWHVLRDVRDEAAVCAGMRHAAQSLSNMNLESQAARLKRAEILTEVGKVIGRAKDCGLRIHKVERGYRTVPRARVSKSEGSLVSGYRRAKAEAIQLLEMMMSLGGKDAVEEPSDRPAREVK